MQRLNINKFKITALILSLFLFRTLFGLSSEFWFDDELQIYLIGLKAYTTESWPFWGPDVVYTQTQIPGALQGLLIAIPLYILPIPESPIIFLNVLSSASIVWFAFYLKRQINTLPMYFIIAWCMLLVWPMMYGTRVVNPSYVLVFAIPFFIGFFEALPKTTTNYLKPWQSFGLMGISITLLAQLHLSYVLIVALSGLAFLTYWLQKINITTKAKPIVYFGVGLFIGALTLLPTLISGAPNSSVSSNLQLNWQNYLNAPIILIRYLLFSSFEISYILGGSNNQRMEFIKDQPLAIPFTTILFTVGFVLIGLMLFYLLSKNNDKPQKELKKWFLISFILLYVSFFFSIKGPSSHTFYVLFPMSLMVSLQSINWLINKKPELFTFLRLLIPIAIVFYTLLGIYQYKTRSLYLNRIQIQKAIDHKDYTILGNRRY